MNSNVGLSNQSMERKFTMKSISQKPLKFGALKAGKGVISLKLEKVSETFLLSFTKTMKAKFRIHYSIH